MSKKKNQRKPFAEISAIDIITVAKFFGITDLHANGKKYFVRHWTSDRMLSHHEPGIFDFKTMEQSLNGSFYNPIFEIPSGKEDSGYALIPYEDLYERMVERTPNALEELLNKYGKY